jgi:maleate isomerase
MWFDLRARIGLLVPSLNGTLEPEANIMVPEGVAIHGARMHITETTEKSLIEMAEYAATGARDLGDADCDIIVYGCTSGSFIKGLAWERELVKKLEEVSQTKVISTSGALMRAMEAFGVKRISIATPYIQEVNDQQIKFFTECGYDVLKIKGLDRFRKGEIRSVTPQQVFRLGKEVVSSETELLMLSCTEMRTIDVIRQMEIDLGIPVISSNLAVVWAALRSCGIKEKLTQFGSLFEK